MSQPQSILNYNKAFELFYCVYFFLVLIWNLRCYIGYMNISPAHWNC